MIDALIKRVSVAYKCYEMYAHRETARILRSIKKWTPSYQLSSLFNAVCRIVNKSVQQCTYFLFSVNLLLVGVNYGQRTMQVCS